MFTFQALKPKVKLGCGKELVCKEGETVTIFAEVAGEPPADDIKWNISGTELVNEPKDGVVVDNSKDYKSKLQIDAVSRKHEGKCFKHFEFLSVSILNCHILAHYLIRALFIAV